MVNAVCGEPERQRNQRQQQKFAEPVPGEGQHPLVSQRVVTEEAVGAQKTGDEHHGRQRQGRNDAAAAEKQPEDRFVGATSFQRLTPTPKRITADTSAAARYCTPTRKRGERRRPANSRGGMVFGDTANQVTLCQQAATKTRT